MSIDVHDQYCGSFGDFSDCPSCRDRSTGRVIKRRREKSRASSEALLIGAMVRNAEWIPVVKLHLPDPESFQSLQCRTLARHIYRIHDGGSPVTYAEVGRSLHDAGEVEQAGGYCALHDLDVAFPENAPVEKHAMRLAENNWKGTHPCIQK